MSSASVAAVRWAFCSKIEFRLSRSLRSTSSASLTRCVFLAGLYRSEQAISERLWTFTFGKLPLAWIDPDKALPWIEQKTGLSLAPSHKDAIHVALMAKVLVITGGPSVGKTTIVNSILRILAGKGVNHLLCALTGRQRSACPISSVLRVRVTSTSSMRRSLRPPFR